MSVVRRVGRRLRPWSGEALGGAGRGDRPYLYQSAAVRGVIVQRHYILV